MSYFSLPYLYFVIMNCRRLDLRLKALQHIALVANDRESLFSANTIYSVGIRIVEIEHGIRLNPSHPEYPQASAVPMPPDEQRLKSADITEEVEMKANSDGQVLEFRKVFFLVSPSAIVSGFTEWIRIFPPPRLHAASGSMGAGRDGTCLLSSKTGPESKFSMNPAHM